MDKEELLARYEARGDEEDFLAARPLYERAIARAPTADLVCQYGYLLQCRGSRLLREALDRYEQALQLDPAADKAHWQLIWIHAMLRQPERAVAIYERMFAAVPDLRERRFLARAYALAGVWDRSRELVDGGLATAPEDWQLIELRGDIRAANGDPGGALADWRRAHELEPENLSSIYSSAFLLEREGRIDEAVAAWRHILEWSRARGNDLDAEWPRREIDRLSGQGTPTG